jgi:hypothetical protein
MADTTLGSRMNRSHRTFDKLLELRNGATAQITATTAETGIAFEARKQLEYVCELDISVIDRTTGDETYVFTIGVCATVGGTYLTIATLTIPTSGAGTDKTGIYIIPVSGATAEMVLPTAAFINITATLGGTTPILKYSAQLAQARV